MSTSLSPASGPIVHVAPDRSTDHGRRARRDAAVRLACGAALWLSLLLVAYWWAVGRGISDLAGWETGLTSSGRLFGLTASVLLLAQVVLMARVPVVESAFGQDRLARLHRWVGFASFNLMVAHVVLVTWGYSAGRLLSTPRELWDLTVDYPGMLIGVAGALCLVMVVLTSLRAARRRLRYESWHLMHLYAYLGVGLALPHQLWSGQEFVSSPGRTVFWWTAWALAAAAVLLFRVGLPAARTLRHTLRVASVVEEGPGVASVYLTGRRLDRLRVDAGQFVTLRFLSGRGWSRAHPYSLSAAPDGRSLRVTVQAVGDGSRAVWRLRPGTRVLVEGPYGRLGARARTRRKVALIGAGVGITPLRSLAEGLDVAPGELTLIYRYTDQPLFRRELEVLRRERGIHLMFLPGRRRGPDSWCPPSVGALSDPDVVRRCVPDLEERDVFVCGPTGWTERVRTSLLAAGLPAEQLHFETFAW